METVELRESWAGGASRLAPRRRGARRRVPVTPAYPAGLSEGVLLPFGAEGPGAFFCAGVPQVPTPECLLGGAGALAPTGPRAGDVGSWDGVGKAQDLQAGGLTEDLPPYGLGSAGFVALFLALSVGVFFQPSKAEAVWNWGPAVDPGGVEPVFWNAPACYLRTVSGHLLNVHFFQASC